MRRSLLAICSLVVVLAAGCGGAEEAGVGENPLAALDASVKRTGEVESLRQKVTMEADFEEEQLSAEAEGTFSTDMDDGTMTMTVVTGGNEVEFDAILVDGTMYMKGDELQIPEGKKWLKTQTAPTATMDPADFVRFLRESPGVENVGTEEVRGEQTTHFRGPLDLERLVEASGGEAIERFKASPVSDDIEILVDLWVTDSDLPSRMAVKLTAPGKASGALTMTSDIFEYDVPVDAEAPPADEVYTP